MASILPPGVSYELQKYLRYIGTVHRRNTIFNAPSAAGSLPGQLVADLVRSRAATDNVPVWLSMFANKPANRAALRNTARFTINGHHYGRQPFMQEYRDRRFAGGPVEPFWRMDDDLAEVGNWFATAREDLTGQNLAANRQQAFQRLIAKGYSPTFLRTAEREGVDLMVLELLERYPHLRALMQYMVSMPEHGATLYLSPIKRLTPLVHTPILRWSDTALNDLMSMVNDEDEDLPAQVNPDLTRYDQPVANPVANPILMEDTPALREVIRDMQSPLTLALLLMTLYTLGRSVSPASFLLAKFTTLTRRGVDRDNVHFRLLNVPARNHVSIRVDASTTFEALVSTIQTEFRDALMGSGQRDSDFDLMLDGLIVLGLGIKFVDPVLPSPLNVGGYHQLPLSGITTRMRKVLGKLRAFAYPKQLFNDRGRLAIPLPPLPFKHCIAEAFAYTRAVLTGAFERRNSIPREHRHAYNKALSDHIAAYVAAVKEDTDVLEGGNVLQILEYLLSVEADHFSTHDQTGVVYLVFFAGHGRCPPLPSMRLTYDGEKHEIEVPANRTYYFSSFEAADEEFVLVYYHGHIFPSTMGQFRACISLEASQYVRINTVFTQRPPDPYELRPLDYTKKRSRNTGARINGSIPLLAQYKGCADTVLELDKSSADYETGRCTACSDATGCEVQDAFAASVAWGTGQDDVANFVGHECPLEARHHTFDTYDGCITQMLRWYKTQWGWYSRQSASQHAPSKILTRWVYFFNGARFDLFLLFKTLQFWKEPCDIIMLGNSLIKLTWGNYVFCDFAQIYPHYKLDDCYTMFAKDPSVQDKLPQTGKWRAFPYGIIRSGMFERSFIPLYELNTVEVWGGRKAKGKEYEEMDLVEANTTYWRTHIRESGVDIVRDLTEYCAEDTRILQLCVIVHTTRLAVGTTPSGRYYNTNSALTSSSAAFSFFRQAYLDQSYSSPKLGELDDVIDPYTLRKVSLSNLFKDSLHGGKTDCFYHCLDDANGYAEKMRAKGLVPIYDDHDFNSKYPHIMHTHEIPMDYIGLEHLSDEVACTEFEPAWLYNVSVKYPTPRASGIILKVAGFCVAFNELPFHYRDPADKTRATFNMVWGVELAEAVRQGATVHARFVLKFRAYPLFREFIQDIYARRKASKNESERLSLKLTMNGAAGKLAQSPKPSPVILRNAIDDPLEQEDDVLISMEDLCLGPEDEQPAILAYVLHRQSYIGQFNYANSYITAAARSDLCKVIYEMEHRCVNLVGDPVVAGYGDTDSIKSTYFDYQSPDAPACNVAFAAEFIDQSELGKLKSETARKIDGRKVQGLDLYTMLRKKVGVMHLYDPEHPLPPDADISLMEAADKDSFICKSKGLPHSSVKPSDLLDAHHTGLKKTFPMPLSFQRTLQYGIVKESGKTRSITTGNGCRLPPESDGFLPPFPNVEAFLVSKGISSSM